MTMTKPCKVNSNPANNLAGIAAPVLNQNQWRLIPLIEAPGGVQMAIDAWLLEQHRQRLSGPILRFYTWSPPAVSLGHHQHHWPPAWNHLVWRGQPLDLIRRPSGGRAVLHQGDLTYAIVMSGLKGNRTQVYRQICEFLRQGWQSLGVKLIYGQVGGGYRHNPNCFGAATGADLTLANGRKLIGSAQLWRGNTVLQHGSIRLHPDPELVAKVFGPEALSAGVLSLETPAQQVINALVAAAENCFQAQFQHLPLSEDEYKAASTYSAVTLMS